MQKDKNVSCIRQDCDSLVGYVSMDITSVFYFGHLRGVVLYLMRFTATDIDEIILFKRPEYIRFSKFSI